LILLVNPRATKPRHRRFPLSVMALGAALPEGTSWEILDGNLPGADLAADLPARAAAAETTDDPVTLVAVTAMPGPQLVDAVRATKALKARFPALPVVWGGYFPTLYPNPVVAAPYVDWIVRGQGERTLVELLDVLAGRRDPKEVAGLGYRDGGSPRLNPERPWLSPDAFPPPPYGRIDVETYLHPTFLGRRNAVYQASIGCPYSCSFCGVIAAYGSVERFESPERTEKSLRTLVEEHRVDAVHFYDSNFFLKEAHAVDLCARLERLSIRWWCEARVDAMLRFSDATWETIRRSGLAMVFFGAESGSDETLAKMSKRLTTAETVAVADLTRRFGIVPEFSFVLGDPDDPEGDIETTLAFVRKLKRVNPDLELITYFYTPTPQRRGTYGNVDPLEGTPESLEEWTEPAWVDWMTHEDPALPWLPRRLKARVEDFELVLKSRFPSIHDARTRAWGKALARLLAKRRWETERYERPWLLRKVRKWARLPADRQLYGHLRPGSA
jgi:anaerobic magnesium-protoporphyrin IX monomethyl ester cyclase